MGPGDLHDMLGRLRLPPDAQVLVDMSSSDDAGVVRLAKDRALVHTVDVITPIVDDPATFGQVAAANAVSDVYAMGGRPTSAVAILSLPPEVPARALAPMMQAAGVLLQAAGAPLIGGHTLKDRELRLGFAVTGEVDPRRMTTNQDGKVDDVLVLTKALGTGVLFQAMKADARTAAQTRALVTSMVTTNEDARDAMVEMRLRCATDVTGFGLAGHALNIARSSDVDVVLEAGRLPALPGVVKHLMAGVYPGTSDVNRKGYGRRFVVERGVPEMYARLVADPQTSGGLLIAVSPRRLGKLLTALGPAWVVGRLRAKRSERASVRLVKRVDGLPEV